MADYKQGEYCWFELGTRDIGTALRFYTSLMNWATISHDMGEMGARVLMPPQDIPRTGRFSVLQDPTGAAFALIALLPM